MKIHNKFIVKIKSLNFYNNNFIMDFFIYSKNSWSSIPPLLFRPNEIGKVCSDLCPNVPRTSSIYRMASIRIASASSVCADVWNWKWGGSGSPAAVLPVIIVVVNDDFDVAFPSCGKRTSKYVTVGRPPRLPLLPSRDRHVSSKLRNIFFIVSSMMRSPVSLIITNP